MPQPSGSTGHPAGTAVKLDDMFQAETGLDDDDDDDDEGGGLAGCETVLMHR
jgi:hypothetical protein